jgi:hypothetical protein
LAGSVLSLETHISFYFCSRWIRIIDVLQTSLWALNAVFGLYSSVGAGKIIEALKA